MPKFGLELRMNLENLKCLRADSGTDFRWYLKLKCTNCGETPDHWHYVCLEEEQHVTGSRGTAHFVEKCKLCSRQNTLEILKDTPPLHYSADKNREFQRIVAFDCRGLEPIDFDPRVGWIAEGLESGSLFADIDLSEKEWCEYDETAKNPVEINELSHRFVAIHEKK